MRFEIRAGGALLFLVGLAALSGTVFALGLIAGYEMARQNQVDSSQLATSYPLPSPQAAAASPTAASSPAVAAAASGAAPAVPPINGHSASAARAAAQPAPAEEAPEESSVPPPSGAEEEEATTEPYGHAPPNPVAAAGAAAPGVASTPPASVAASEPAPTRRHPYNIQIDAVMDSAGAQQMADRLRKLGYTATIVPSTVAGQTWYKVKVGPYSSAEEARAAQERLRAQYNAAYSGH